MAPDPRRTESAMREATAHHQGRRLSEAEKLYRAVLEVQPTHPQANHNLGVLLIQKHKVTEGLPYLKTALAAAPDQEDYRVSLAKALMLLHRAAEASALLEQGARYGVVGAEAEALLDDARRQHAALALSVDDILGQLALYAPNSAGPVPMLAELTLLSARQLFGALVSLAGAVRSQAVLCPIPMDTLCFDPAAGEAAARLKELFDRYGSDKASVHDYHRLYGAILTVPDSVGAVLEIGLGSTDEAIVSNMGRTGRPGASLRAFRDFLPKARIFGADIDRTILFEEDRIWTAFVDQTSPESLTKLDEFLPADIDLIIDDGLHAPNANVATLAFSLQRLKEDGWVVVEDIAPDSVPVWQIVAAILPNTYKPLLIEAKAGYLFAVQRLPASSGAAG